MNGPTENGAIIVAEREGGKEKALMISFEKLIPIYKGSC